MLPAYPVLLAVLTLVQVVAPRRSGLPLRWDARPRDAEIAYVNAFVDARIAAGERVLVMGDVNVTDREPANADLSRGLRDAHDIAWGAGASWGPLALRRHGLALIRIDRVLGGPAPSRRASTRTARSTAATTASCTPRSPWRREGPT
jgi:endonuclease/exonuclease/phosphatase family metal-dependent hydrolase